MKYFSKQVFFQVTFLNVLNFWNGHNISSSVLGDLYGKFESLIIEN